MPFNRPTLATIITRILADINSRLPGTDARLRRRLLNVLGTSLGGAAHGLHGHLDFLSRQFLPDTAEVEYLDRLASIWGVARKPAVAATGNVTLTGTNGVDVPAGTVLQRADGAEYTTDALGTVAGGTVTVAITATVAGADGNTAAAVALTLVVPIAGIDSAATVAVGGLIDGVDTENDDSLRSRLQARIQQPPHGGAAFDYVKWALDVEDVTRAWCFPLNRGNGTVDVYFVVDDHAVSIIPDAAKVQEVQDYIDALRPVTADALAVAPTAAPINFTIAIVPPTAEVKAATLAELEDLLRREAEPGDGLNSGTILLSHIREAISLAAGETDYTLTAPNADVVPAAGEIATMGVITWA